MADGVSISAHVQFNQFNAIADRLSPRVAAELDRSLAAVEQQAAANAPFVSGALRASHFRVSPLYNGFEAAVQAFQSLSPTSDVGDAPAFTPGAVRAAVGFAAGYAVFVHDGHHTVNGDWIPGNPFLTTAFEANRQRIFDALKSAVESAARG